MRYLVTHRGLLLSVLSLLFLLLSTAVNAEQYIITVNNSNKYLAINGASGIKSSDTLNPDDCFWSADGTMGDSGQKQKLYQIVNETRYYLDVNDGQLTVTNNENAADEWYIANGSQVLTTGTYSVNKNFGINQGVQYNPGYDYDVVIYKINSYTYIEPSLELTVNVTELTVNNGTNYSVNVSPGNYYELKYTLWSNVHTLYYYNGTMYNTAPQITATPEWSIEGAGSSYVAFNMNDDGRGGYIRYQNGSSSDIQVTIRVTYPGYNNISASCTITLKGTGSGGGGNTGGDEGGGNTGGDDNNETVLVDGTYYIRNKSREYGQNNYTQNNYYLSPSENIYQNDDRYIKVAVKSGDTDQLREWQLVSAGGGYYQIKHKSSNRYIVLKNGTNNDNTYQSVYLATTETAQGSAEYSHFSINKVHTENGVDYYSIVPRMMESHQQGNLRSFNASSWNQGDIQLLNYMDENGAYIDACIWAFEFVEDNTPEDENSLAGTYYIRNANTYYNYSPQNSSIVIDGEMYMYPSANSNLVRMIELRNVTDNARWTLIKVGEYYKIRNNNYQWLTVKQNAVSNNWENVYLASSDTQEGSVDYALFKVGEHTDGTYYIIPKIAYESASNSGLSLNPDGSGMFNLHLETYTNALTARWVLETSLQTEESTSATMYAFTNSTDGFKRFLGIDRTNRTVTTIPEPMNPEIGVFYCDGQLGNTPETARMLYVVVDGTKYYLAVVNQNDGYVFTLTSNINAAHYFYLDAPNGGNRGTLSIRIDDYYYKIDSNYRLSSSGDGSFTCEITNLQWHEFEVGTPVLSPSNSELNSQGATEEYSVSGATYKPAYYEYNSSSHGDQTEMYYYEGITNVTSLPEARNMDGAVWSLTSVSNAEITSYNDVSAVVSYTKPRNSDITLQIKVTYPNQNYATATANVTLKAVAGGEEDGNDDATATDTRYAFTLYGNTFLGVNGYNVVANNGPLNPETSAWSCDAGFGDKNSPQPLYVVIEGKKYYLALNGTSFTLTDDINNAGRFYLNNGVLSATINGTDYGIVNNNGSYLMEPYNNGAPSNNAVLYREITNIKLQPSQIKTEPIISLTIGERELVSLWSNIQLELSGGTVVPSHYTYNSSHSGNTTLYYYENAQSDNSAPHEITLNNAQWEISESAKKYLTIQQWGHGAFIQYAVESANNVEYSVIVTYPGIDGVQATFDGLSIRGTGTEGEGPSGGTDDDGGSDTGSGGGSESGGEGEDEDDVVIDSENTYCAPAGRYVIQSDGYYLARENGNIVATTSFNPSTCIWNATEEYRDGNTYLKFNNNGGDLNLNGNYLWRVTAESEGMIQQLYNTNNYLHYHASENRWVVGDEPDGCAIRILSENGVQEKNSNPMISTNEPMPFAELRSYKIDIIQEAVRIPAYTDYTLADGSHLYWVQNQNRAYKAIPPSEMFSYEWSMSNETSGYAVIDQSGILAYKSSFDSERTYAVTLTAKRTDGSGNLVETRVATLNVTFARAEQGMSAKPVDKYYIIHNFENSNYVIYPSENRYNGTYNLVRTAPENETNLENSVWIVREFDEKYVQIIHEQTGRYMITHNNSRGQSTSVHLSDSYTDINSTLFEIGEYPTDGKIPYYIMPINAESYTENNIKIEMGLNPYGGNGNSLSLYMYYDGNKQGVKASLWTLKEAKASTPVITTDGTNVTIVSDTKGATIYFTTDGTEPTTSSRVYDGTFPLGLNHTIKAIAVAEGYIQSDVAGEEFHRIASLDRIPADGATGYYILMNDVNASSFTTKTNFKGVFDGGYHTITGLHQPLFDNVVDATIKNVVLDNVAISKQDGNVGAIVCNASGSTKIYNCGVLATDGSVIAGGNNVGSIVGQIEGHTKVVNCYSYATVTGRSVGGIVGSNTATASTVNYITTMIMNCIFYGDLEGSYQVSPVYGGTEISNRNNLNTYCYYKVFDEDGGLMYDVTQNNSVMPITEESYLDRFEFYRNILNSQRELASYYAFESLLLSDEIGKWVLRKDVAPYPIVVKQEYNTRKTIDRAIPETDNGFSGKKLGTVKATFRINGKEYVLEDMPVTDMDTTAWDYTYGKIVLPFANEFEGWKPIDAAYNSTDYSYTVSGWKVVSVDGISSINQTYDFDFTNPENKAKDIYNLSGSRDASFNPYVYAQGGNYVVPDGAKELVFEANWAKCVYLSDVGEDVSYNPNFDQATQIGNRTWEEQTDVIASSSFRDISYKDNWVIDAYPVQYANSFTTEIFDNISHTLEFFCWEQDFRFSIRTNRGITLEPGTYMLRMYGFSRYGINEEGAPKRHGPNGNPVKYYVKGSDGNYLAIDTLNSVYDHTSQEMNAVRGGYDEFNTAAANTMDGYVNSLTTAIIAYNHGYFMNELQFTIDETQTIEIGVFSDGNMPSWSWATFRDMKLYKLKDDTFQDRTFQDKKIYHTLTDAMRVLDENNEIPADQAVVLVGNYHLNDMIPGNSFADAYTKAVTMMSIDKNNDQEPDYCCYTYTSNPDQSSRTTTPPLRWDFITAPGIGMAARVSGSSAFPGIGIWHTKGWYETTETYLGLHTEAEINPSEKNGNWMSPWIINGGIYKSIISNYDGEKDLRTNNNGYIRMGGNVYVEKFHPGNHEEKNFTTYLMPVNVSGGEIVECYMTGRAGATDYPQTAGNVRFWSNGGYIHNFLGAYMAPVNGDVTARINRTVIDEFYGGGSDANRIVSGKINVTANNSWIAYYVGGPKVGDMNENTSVETNARGTHFGNYYGGGYGGTSLSRKTVYDAVHKVEVSISDDLRYPASFANYVGRRLHYDGSYGVAIDYGFEYFFAAGGNGNLVSRFFVDYATLSLATVREVKNTLKDCIIDRDFYGGGRQGYVSGNVTSVLDNTTVNGNAFGAGYTGKMINADVATESQPNYSTYLFELGVITPFGATEYETFTWQKAANMNVPASNEAKKLYTTTDMSLMGKVEGKVAITVKGTSVIGGNLFGGGNQADVVGATQVIMPSDETTINGTVYGGGNESNIEGSTDVRITGGTINGNLFGGGNMGRVTESSNVYVGVEL